MSEDVGNGGRISVSRDALRAELAEFKLQLLSELRAELDRKASKSEHISLEMRVAALERKEVGEMAVEIHNTETFTKREKTIALIVSGLVLFVLVFQAWHG